MKKITALMLVLGISLGIGIVSPVGVHAASVISTQCDGVTDSTVCAKKDQSSNTLIKTLINTLLFLVGAISVIMIIAGGLMYAVSGNDSGAVTRAKNTIIYSIIGLIVAALAYAIVQFVYSQFVK